MDNRWVFLTVLALMIVGTAFCEISEVTKIPASQDVYFGMDKEGVYNTDTLRCAVDVMDENGSKVNIYSGVPMIQFNISSIKMTESDIGILVLKAASIKKQSNESAMIAVMPVDSDWNENSSYLNLVFNLKPIIDIVEKNDITKMEISTNANSDGIVTFDVSKKLLDAKANGSKVSFLLMAISNTSYSVDFKSRETGEGPYLIVMPYPSEAKTANIISLPTNKSAINQTALQSNESVIKNLTNNSINSSAINNTAISNSITNNSIKVPLNRTVAIQITPPREVMNATIGNDTERYILGGNTSIESV